MRIAKIMLLASLFAAASPFAAARSGYVKSSPCGPDGCRPSLFGGNTLVQYKVEYLQGKIWRHSLPARGLADKSTHGAEFAVEFPQKGGAPWVFHWNFPTVGMAFQYLNLGNNRLVGDAFALYPYINMPLFHASVFSLNVKLGAGVSCITKKYDESRNKFPIDYASNNYAIGSTVNAFLTAGVNFDLLFSRKQYGFWSHWGLTGGIAVNHYTNGGIRMPDMGLDVVNASVGLKYIPYMTLCPMRSGLTRIPRKWSYEPTLTVGANRLGLHDGRLYPCGTLDIGAFRPLTNIYRIGVTVDAFFNSAFTSGRTEPSHYAGGETGKFRAGIALSNELMFGKFMAGLQVGVYFINKQTDHDGRCYLRTTAKYFLTDSWFLAAALKTHRTEAESLEIGVGYSIFKKEKAPYSWLPQKKQDKGKQGNKIHPEGKRKARQTAKIPNKE